MAATTTTTEAGHELVDLWSGITADDREQNMVHFNAFDRRYEAEMSGKNYERILIHSIGDFTTTPTIGTPGAAITFAAGVFNAEKQLAIDTHAYQAFDLELEVDMMTNINVFEKLAHKAGYSVAIKMDDDAAALVASFGTNVRGVLGNNLSDSDIRGAVDDLNKVDAPEDGRVFIYHSTQDAELMATDKYINSLYRPVLGSISTDKFKGFKGSLYGMDWYMSTNTTSNGTGHDNGIWQREVIATAVIDNMRVAQHYEISTDSMRYAVHAIYGLVEVRDNHGVWMKGL